MNVKFNDIVKVVDKRPKEILLDHYEVAGLINSRYDWEEFGDLDEDSVVDWLVGEYGWDRRFTIKEAHALCDYAALNGFSDFKKL